MAQKPYSWRRTIVRFLLASVLLNIVIVASMLTSTPLESPASTWITAANKIYYDVKPVTDKEELQELHFRSSEMPREKCIACHGEMTESKMTLHRIHLTSELLLGIECHNCHKKVSLQKRSNVFVVRMVDVGFCKDCHSKFPGGDPNSAMKPEDFEADCTTCHSGKHHYRHEKEYLSHVIAPRECKGCHGGRVLPWTTAHEKDDWIQKHGPEALTVGAETCQKCHEFGLQFCNECHSKKPPSHNPRDAWLNVHKTRAQQDTRTCFTCHKSDYCKKCHVNHTANWLNRHPKYVLDEGTQTCQKCHSQSFCSFCHMEKAGRDFEPAPPTSSVDATKEP